MNEQYYMGYLPYPLDVLKSTKFILIMEIINTKKIHTPSFPLKKERKKKKPSSPS